MTFKFCKIDGTVTGGSQKRKINCNKTIVKMFFDIFQKMRSNEDLSEISFITFSRKIVKRIFEEKNSGRF